MTNGLITLCFSELKNESKMTILCSMMVAQQQPKSLQCHYLVEHASQPQTVTVNNQLRTKRSSDFVTLRSKVHGLYLLHAVSCGQKRHASNRTVLHSTCTKQGCLRQCRSDQCWLAETFGGQTKPTTNLSCWKMLCWSDRCCVAKTIRLENTTFSDTIYLSINLSIYLSVYLSVCLSIYLSICKLENEAILRDFLSFWTWQHQKRSNSARLPDFFPRTSERRVLLTVWGSIKHFHIFTSLHNILQSSHLLIFTSSHLHICSSSHLLIFSSSSHLHICSSSNLLIFTSSHLHICSSSHLHILSCPLRLHIIRSSHLLIFPSSHLHIFSSSHLHILTSSHSLLPSCSLALLLSPSFLFLSWRRGAVPTRRRETQPFRTKRSSIAKKPKTAVKLRFLGSGRNPFARNEVRSPKSPKLR